jgi:hypothetical protein
MSGHELHIFSVERVCLPGEETMDKELRQRYEEENSGDLQSIHGKNIDSHEIAQSRLVCDIKEFTSVCWWIFRHRGNWFIVKYDDEQGRVSCKLYVGPDGETAFYWDPTHWGPVMTPVSQINVFFRRSGKVIGSGRRRPCTRWRVWQRPGIC